MAWSDKPTDHQLDAIHNFLGNHTTMPRKKALAAVEYLSRHATRREVSDELGRLREMYINRKLNRNNCFNSSIWEDFEFNDDDLPSSEQNALIYAIFRHHMPLGRAAIASSWLGQNATRKQVAIEIDRIKELEKKYALDEKSCFASSIWERFNHEELLR